MGVRRIQRRRVGDLVAFIGEGKGGLFGPAAGGIRRCEAGEETAPEATFDGTRQVEVSEIAPLEEAAATAALRQVEV